MGRQHYSIARIITAAAIFLGLAVILAWQMAKRDGPDRIVFPRAQEPYELSRYSISMERTACFGPCPVFTLSIDGNGLAKLKIVDDKREMSVDIGKARLSEMVKTLENGDFRSLDPDYSAQITDLPSTIISINSPLGAHKVSVYGVPCVSSVKKIPREQLDRGVEKYVPDVFCALESQLDEITCLVYGNYGDLSDKNEQTMWHPAPYCEAQVGKI